MDESLGRRTATGIIFSRGGCSIIFQQRNCHHRSIRFCSRLGCSASLYSMNDGTRVGHLEKASLDSGSSKSSREQRSRKSHRETDVVESSNRQRDIDKLKCSSRSLDIKDSDSNRGPGKREKSNHVPVSPIVESAKLCHFSENATRELELRSRASKQATRQPKHLHKPNSSTSDSTSMTLRHCSHDMASGSEKYGLENHRRTAISDVLPSGFNSADSGINRTDNNLRKRSYKRGSSSYRGKSLISSSNGTNSGSSDTGNLGLNPSMPDHLLSRQTTRSINRSSSADVVSIRTRPAPRGDTRMRPIRKVDDRILVSKPVTVGQRLQRESVAVPRSSSRSSTEFRPFCRNINGQPGSGTQNAPHILVYESAESDTSLEDRDDEVLSAHEMIEQDGGLTYEQSSVLENHLFLDSPSIHDQYRDMRMDIDNMSYEELLALGEKLGTVSTALTEEALSRCLKRSKYLSAELTPGIPGLDEGDVKCSICQEEFVVGDELGEMVCEHIYHETCIHQWLGLKDWCPICKTCVSPNS